MARLGRGSRGHWLLVTGLALGHLAFRPLLVEWPGSPDLLAGALLLAALRLRSGAAAGLGFGLGLLEGSMALEGLGATMIVYTIAGFVAARSRDLLFTDARVFLPLYLFSGAWLVQAAVALASGAGARAETLLVLAPVSAALTTLVCWSGMRLAAPYPYA